MNIILVVWTEGERLDDSCTDHWETRETLEEAQELYNSLIENGDVLVASITGVIESSDYDPHIFENESEKQLSRFLEAKKDNYSIELRLKSQGDHNLIERSAVNICTVSLNGTNEYMFGGISEDFYDRMVGKFEKQTKSEIDRDCMLREVEGLLIDKWVRIGSDKPSNHDEIKDFIINDIVDTADPDNWHSGDFDIAFRRWIEAQDRD